jgi:2-(1,2-epoxy-1,2-dihydrophenyl)acetyl-CoA isomerase
MTAVDPARYQSVDGLDLAVDGAVLSITLNRPGHRNSLTDTSMTGLIRALESASTDDGLRAVLLSGAGDDFCSGFDIVGRNTETDVRPRTGSIQRRMPVQANHLIPLLREIQLPVVCAARGWVVGIGAQLMLCSDFAVVADDARIWYPFIDRGFTPDSGSTWLLPRVVGRARARELLILGRRLSGAEAVEWGLAHQAVPAAEVDNIAGALAQRLAHGPTAAIGLTKALLNSGESRAFESALADEGYAMELSSRSPDFREGLKAFVDKRDPDFTGR